MKSHSKLMLQAIAACASALVAFNGCQRDERPVAEITTIACRLTFNNISQASERTRVYETVRGYANVNTLQPTTAPSQPDFDLTFAVANTTYLDAIHTELLYPPREQPQSGTGNDALAPAFNTRGPAFYMTYDTIRLDAGLRVLVRFTVTPGAKLFYRPEGENEREVKEPISAAGVIEFPASIRRGQEWIYARTEAGIVQRFIRINVYTQKVEDIPRNAYPK